MPDEQPWSPLKSKIYSFLYRNPKSNRLAMHHFDLNDTDHCLDIGCGPGAAVRSASRMVASITGVDASEPMIAGARKRASDLTNASFEVAPAESLPFDDARFSVVWTIQSWHHWNDDQSAFAEVLRVLQPNGRFSIVEKDTTGEHGITEPEARQLADSLVSSGFADAAVDRSGKYLFVTGHK